MNFVSTPTWAAAALMLACSAASAAPLFGADNLQRNGAVSRHLWTPDATTLEVAGYRVSAGVALGLRGPVRDHLDRRFSPAFTVDLGDRSSLSLLPAGDRGAMLVWQARR